ncbi:signal peptidase I [Paenibacillus baekrokdamisoli]|uniref:Signal peptidase I n=1 Tax=Paenibacillus baekrokdamisoli TaxID=1712516 RepID=A0A3G9IQX7_9BACL|nr:signal peptidase I [Paenibacillus baekrokdamisoli]MBB3069860.1 signal peptidase I [Paenibacillus baekrokdamisoli]BBH20786.1 signal peptidase I [Paenibacillus baekrokdamisoli]
MMNTEQQQETIRKKKSWGRELRDWAVSLSIAIVVALLIQNYAFAQTEVRNISMQHTLVEGQRLIEDKISYHFEKPNRGDIVIIDGPESDIRLIKRVIGLPGDKLEIKNGVVFINGEALIETYIKGSTFPNGMSVPFIVPADKVFVMGDNREHSEDSRALGPIAISSLEGRAIFRLWPLQKFGKLE